MQKGRPCGKCHGFGRYQSYLWGRVTPVYCQCPVGRRKVEEIREALRELGLDPYAPEYSINQEHNT
jgi:hypothetical protein